jgi:pyridoxal phosphate enzyme (YggS family)
MAKRTVLGDKLAEIRDRVASACARVRRDPSEVTVLAVTKYAAPEQIREILSLGVTDLGESRVQQLTQRAAQISEYFARRASEGPGPVRVRWHMIGHLQRKKVKSLLPAVSLIHSVDSLRLAEEIDAQAQRLGRRIPVLLQVNASEEPQKHGVAVGASTHLAEQMDSMPGLQLLGLMTMGELDAPPERIRHTFARTREIFEEMRFQKIGGAGLRHLSMGMSNDYEIAIEEGATMIRLGTALFGGKPDTLEEDDG